MITTSANPIKVKSEKILIILIMALSLLVQFISVRSMPLFSDSAFHATVIRDINETGNFPSHSPVGWVALDMHPTSFEPFLTHPPLFYIANSMVNFFGIDIITSLTILSIVPTVLAVYFFYKLIKSFFNSHIALISSLLLALMPMSVWLTSHRIMEPFQYLMAICSFYYAKKYLDEKSQSSLLLSAVFASAILYIKITSLFVVFALGIYLVASKIGLKKLLFFGTIITLLYSPYVYFAISTRGTVSYAPPGFPILDSKILNPWWKWPLSEPEQRLNQNSNQEALLKRLRTYDQSKRLFLQDNIRSGNILNILQYYNAYIVSTSANVHWYSSLTPLFGVFLLLFILGLIYYIKSYRSTKFHFLLIPLFILTTLYLTQVTEIRYFYMLNILLLTFYALAIYHFFVLLQGKIIRLAFPLILSVLVVLSIVVEIQSSSEYRNSLLHNLMPNNAGISELQKVDKGTLDKDKNIFTPANSEVAYYLDKRTIWDYRLLFVDEATVKDSLARYNVSTIILPNYYFNSSFVSAISKKEVVNSQNNWEGGSVPLDSDFYKFISDSSLTTLIGNYKAFRIYEVKP